jgi:hypothetical protein
MNKSLVNNILLNLGIENLNEMQIAAQTIWALLTFTFITGSGRNVAFLLPYFRNVILEILSVQCLFLFPSWIRDSNWTIWEKKIETDYRK